MAKYGKKASKEVGKAMRERKRGELKSGGSGKTVKSRKQAIAIGLAKARRAGGKVPAKKGAKSAAKSSAKKSTAKRTNAKTSSAKQSNAKKSTASKRSAAKSAAKKRSAKNAGRRR